MFAPTRCDIPHSGKPGSAWVEDLRLLLELIQRNTFHQPPEKLPALCATIWLDLSPPNVGYTASSTKSFERESA
ncbi:MAG: hypothetical protein KIS67_05225 [Verrucomicrobiae bacterium]|nr:hypothetical protein [Verrucomicrobiae bacterium]